jgi:hypothetical protein
MTRRKPPVPPAPWIHWIAQDWAKPGRTVGRCDELCLTADTRKGHGVLRVGLRHAPMKSHPDADALMTRATRVLWRVWGDAYEAMNEYAAVTHSDGIPTGAKGNPLRPAHHTAVEVPDLLEWARALKKGPDALRARLAGPAGAFLIEALLTTVPSRDQPTAHVAAAVLAHNGAAIAPDVGARLDAVSPAASEGGWRALFPSALAAAIDRAALVGALTASHDPAAPAAPEAPRSSPRTPRAM